MPQKNLTPDEVITVLSKFQETIDSTKHEMSKLEGVLSTLHFQLKELGYNDLGEAKTALGTMTKKLTSLEEGLSARMEKFQEKMKAVGSK